MTEDGAFDGIRALTRVGKGAIAVGDLSRSVRLYGLDGHVRVTFGGIGGGPAEFEAVDVIAQGRGDTVWVGDGSRLRVAAFTLEGDFLDSYPILDGPPRYGARILGFAPGGDPIFQSLRLVRSAAPGLEGPISPNFLEWHRYDRQDRRVIPLGRGPWREEWGLTWQGQAYEGEVIYGARSRATVSQGQLLVARSGDEFVVERLDTLGHLMAALGRPYETRRPTASEREAYVEERLLAADTDQEAEGWRAFYQGIPTRDTYPAISGLLGDATGSVWVRPAGPVHEDWVRWSVFDSSSQWLGDVTLPGSFEPKEIGEDYVLGVDHDAFDVESVVLFELVKPLTNGTGTD